MLAILGRYIEGKWFSTGKRCRWIRISSRQIVDFKTLSCGGFTSWGGWCSGQRWHRLWSLLSALIGRRCTCSFASPTCLRIFCCAILARKASCHVVLMKHSLMSFYRSLHCFMPRKLNTPLLLFSDLSTRYLDAILRFLYCGAQKPSFGRFGHIQVQAAVRLFQLYMTSLPCHRSRHVEYLQEISCCVKQWDAAITSTIYAFVVSSKVIKACVVNYRRCLSRNSSPKIPEITTSWCSISRTVRTNALVDHGGFPLWAARNWSCSSWRTPAAWYMVNWRPLTMVWIYSQPTACCFLFVLLPVLLMILKCASRVIFLVAALAASRWTNCCLCSCCVPISDKFVKAPANRLDSDPLGPGWGHGVSMICWCGIAEEDEYKKKWEVLRIILLASCQNGIFSCQHVHYSEDESCCA